MLSQPQRNGAKRLTNEESRVPRDCHTPTTTACCCAIATYARSARLAGDGSVTRRGIRAGNYMCAATLERAAGAARMTRTARESRRVPRFRNSGNRRGLCMSCRRICFHLACKPSTVTVRIGLVRLSEHSSSGHSVNSNSLQARSLAMRSRCMSSPVLPSTDGVKRRSRQCPTVGWRHGPGGWVHRN